MTFVMPTLYPHQEPVKDWIAQRPKAGVFLDVGGGKSLSTLSALAQVRPNGHILVVAPINIARSTWLDEIDKFGFPLRTKSLIVNERDKKLDRKKRLALYEQVFNDPPTMYFINVDLVHDLVDQMPVVRMPDGTREIQWPFPTVIIDESQAFKNPTSRRFKALAKIHSATTRLIELTGTPTPQSLLDLWSQMYLLDGGLALGEKFVDYRAKYFTADRVIDGRVVSWKLLPGAEDAIYAAVAHKVMSAPPGNIPKPPTTITPVNVTLPYDVMEEYKSFAKHLVMELAVPPTPEDPHGTATIAADNAAILHGKLLQFASGTMYLETVEDVVDKPFAVVHEEKLLMTEHLIENGDGSPTLIAYRFRSDRAQLMAHLSKKGYHVETFDGSREMVRRWNAGQIQVMLLQPASAGHGLNLQDGGHTLIWYTLPDSLEHWIQTNGRLARIGQQHPVQIWCLVTKGTRDERLPVSLEQKKAVQDGLLNAVRVELYDLEDDLYEVLGDLDINPL